MLINALIKLKRPLSRKLDFAMLRHCAQDISKTTGARTFKFGQNVVNKISFKMNLNGDSNPMRTYFFTLP